MQSPMQAGMFQSAQLAPAVPPRPRLMSPYHNTAGPLRVIDPRFGVPQNHPALHPATHARPNSAPVATGPAPHLAMPHRLYTPSSLQPTSAYRHHQYPNMTSVAPAPTFPQPNFGRPGISSSNATSTNALVNAPFNPRFVPYQHGYGMQPGYYNPAGNAMLAITVQCPLGQPMMNNPNTPSVQKPVAHPASYHPGMHTIIPPHHWDFSPQGLFSHRPLFPNGSTMTQAQEPRMQNGTKDEPQEYRLPSVKVEELDATTMAEDTRSSVLQQPLPFKGKGRAKRRRTRDVKWMELSSSGIPLPASAGPSTISSGSSPRTGKKRPRVTSCYWDNCGMEVEGDADKLAYTRHLDEIHDFRGLASREMTACLWVDPDTRERCGKELQIQSMIKHVCEIHLNNLGMDCPMCGSYQARIGNMSRHWTVCAEYHNLDEETQRKLWDDIISGAKGFDWYLKHKRERE
ncbi:hypothetical protein M378DRAFT_999671 [Amanita muscaria Koide BX008]|uniref:Uncharacterized protein n=1 Tax=Amanita muscaria (strain Koide BX008) TaxID=946122 RepID=A0A0C2SA24_AMAMK|nr:hypothetical protein M378DRAFT_999671 [Amanita muscaria Koide BX008]